MKITQLAIALLLSISIISCQNMTSVSIETEADSVSYVLGAYQGETMIENFERSKIDSLVNMDLYFEAFNAVTNDKDLKINPDSSQGVLQQFFQKWQTSQMLVAQDTTGTVSAFIPEQSIVDSISYLLGADFGKGLVNNFKKDGMDSILSVPLIIEGYVSALKNDELKINPKENMEMVDAFFKNLQEDKMESQFGDNKRAGEEYLAINRGLETVTVTESGLQYEIIVEGNGSIPTAADKVKVHYHGTFISGEVFDSSVDRGEPATFGVTQVISGWTEALQLMPVGSKWKLSIPYDLAYGVQERGSIPPYSMLIFEVEVIEIVK